MERYHYDHLMQTRPGIGITAINVLGNQAYYFYEDFTDSPGIDRAMKQIYNAMNKGTLSSVVFHDNHAAIARQKEAMPNA